jgi:hypothetical protein
MRDVWDYVRRLGLIGDLGQTENSAETLEHLTASAPGSVINVGDLSYADGYQPRCGSGRVSILEQA